MGDAISFHAVFGSEPNLAYQEHTIHEIQRHRRLLENELFFDRLLKAVGIDQISRLYPPHSNRDLQSLFSRIIDSPSPDHQKHSLVYYILKDLSHRPDAFAARAYLPAKYQTFIDGIWLLDRLKLELALDHLTSPSLLPTFPDAILYTLCTHAPSPTLPLAYYHTCAPPLSSPGTLRALFAHLCAASLTEAFFFARRQPPPTHRVLFEQLLGYVHALPAGKERGTKAVEVVGLPLEEEEGAWLEGWAEGEGEGAGGRDTLVMWKVATGRGEDAVELGGKMVGRKVEGMNWAMLREGLQRGLKGQV